MDTHLPRGVCTTLTLALTDTRNAHSASLLPLGCNTHSLNAVPSGLPLAPPSPSPQPGGPLHPFSLVGAGHTSTLSFLPSCPVLPREPGRLSLLPSTSSFSSPFVPCLSIQSASASLSTPPWSAVCVSARACVCKRERKDRGRPFLLGVFLFD